MLGVSIPVNEYGIGIGWYSMYGFAKLLKDHSHKPVVVCWLADMLVTTKA